MDMQIVKWGNGLAIRIHAEIARRVGLRSGDTLDVQIILDGALTIRAAPWNRGGPPSANPEAAILV